jgi:group I intron endonuclease
METGSIYLITNAVTGRCYVGQTVSSLARRFGGHRADAASGRGRLLAKSMRKHGSDAFSIDALEADVPVSSLDDAERFWVQWYGTIVPAGYNLTSGGNRATKPSAETRAKLSAAAMAREANRSPEARLVVANRLRVLANSQSPEAKEKIGATFRGKPKSPEQRAKMADAARRRPRPTEAERSVLSAGQFRRWARARGES